MSTTTKTLWANVNGVWTDLHIRAWYDSVPVWVDGEFGIPMDNGTHYYASSSSYKYPFVIESSALKLNPGTSSPNNYECTLVSTNLIDFSAYSKVTVKSDRFNDIELNVSGYNGTAYLVLRGLANTNWLALDALLSSTKDMPYNNQISGCHASQSMTTQSYILSITEITIE